MMASLRLSILILLVCSSSASAQLTKPGGGFVPPTKNGGGGTGSYSAGSGISITGSTISVNTTTIQSRVTGTCAAGSSIRVINADGTVTCETDDGGVPDADYGDVTVSGGGATWTIDNGSVTFAKQANIATSTIVGRVTAGAGSPEALTGTQATTLLDVFTSGLKGLAPASGGGTTNFLRADGTWAAPAGAGDITDVIAGSGITGGGSSGSVTLNVGAGTGITVNADDVAITTNGVTDALLRQSAGLSVIGRSANTLGNVADITAGSDGHVLRRSGTTLGFGTVATAGIADNAVTYAKLQDVSATSRFLGRITAGAGDAEELTGTQATTLLDTFSTASTTKGLVAGSNGATTSFLRGDNTWQTVVTTEVGDISNVSVSGPISGGGATGSVTIGMSNADWGDITTSGATPGTTWTIDAGAVSVGELANIATARILGRVTAASGVVEELTGTQATTLLDTFSTSATTKGLVPGSNGGGATVFLNGSGAWSTPAYSSLSGAFSTNNVIPKGNGTGLTSSSITDNGTDVFINPTTRVGAASGVLTGTIQGGTRLYAQSGGDAAITASVTGEDRDVFIGVDTTNDYARVGTSVSQPLVFRTANTDRMTIGATGDVSLTGSLTSGDAAGDVFDHNGDLAKFGSVDGYSYFEGNTLNFMFSQNGAATGYINWNGYNNGTTQFRNLVVADGKNATVATFTGSDKSLAVVGNLSTNASATLGDNSASDVTTVNGTLFARRAQGAAGIVLGDNSAKDWTAYLNGDGLRFYEYTTNFGTGGNDRVTFASGGSVGIGDSSPDYLLDVAGTLGVDGSTQLGDSTADSLSVFGATSISDDGNAFIVYSTPSGGTANFITINGQAQGTYDATASARTAYGVVGNAIATRSAGANNVINVGLYGNASGGQLNRALVTDNGDVVLNDTSGTTSIKGNTAIGDNAADSHTMLGNLSIGGGNTLINNNGSATFGAAVTMNGSNVIGNAAGDAHSLTGTLNANGTAGINNQVLTIVSGVPQWATPAGGGNVTAAGLTTGALPKASGASALVDSLVTESGSTVTVGGILASTGRIDAVSGSVVLNSASGANIDFAYNTNTTAEGRISYNGYNGGTTQFRDLGIYDGKNANIAYFTGSTKATSLKGDLDVDGNLFKVGSSDGSTYISSSSINAAYAADSDGQGLLLNFTGYNGGTTRSRNLVVYDGKNNSIMTVTGATRSVDIDGDSTADSLTTSYSGTAQTARRNALSASNGGTFDTTAGTVIAGAAKVISTSTRSAGANNLENWALEVDSSGGQVNYAIVTSSGDNLFNRVGGSSTFSSNVTVSGQLNGYTQITKSANQDVTNGTNTADSSLSFSTTAGKTYAVEAFLIVSGNNATGDYAFRFATTAGTMDGRGEVISVTTADAIQTSLIAAAAAAATGSVSVGTAADIGFPIAVKVTFSFRQNTSNGTFRLEFGNASASGGRTSRTFAGSWLKYRQLD